ncbi:hypothetical protein L6R52_08935, partial [Myxococcota bacterium]|nr:hypothetical protein [Myxococcota bacterium]
ARDDEARRRTGARTPAPTPATPAASTPATPTATTPATPHTPSGMTSGAPPGYQPIRGAVPPGVVAKARSLLHHEYGTEIPFELDGKRYLARLERHYHPPGYVGGPNGWHKGVTVYVEK